MDIFRRNYCYQITKPLDLDAMKKAAAFIIGEHDFACFQAAGSTPRETTVRTVYDLKISRLGDDIEISISGNGFLYNMVRIIVGTLVEVGLGRRTPESVADTIASLDRSKAGHTAPPQGLYLKEVFYDELPDEIRIEKVEKNTALAADLLQFVENCSWYDARDHIASNIRDWVFTDWEAMFAAVCDGKIVGMASFMKTDYYPVTDIYPWVSGIFVSEKYRGRRISGKLIDCANAYARKQGFERTYIPSEYTGLYEKYGYSYLRDIVNYGGGTDHLFVREL